MAKHPGHVLQHQQSCLRDPASIRNALAIAIVQQKRKNNQEVQEWQAKAQRLEAELQQQADSNAALRAWAKSLLQDRAASASPDHQFGTGQDDYQDQLQDNTSSILLPPLKMQTGQNTFAQQHSAAAPTLEASYCMLQQQLLMTAQATPCAAAASVLSGKAAALSDMLLTNMSMLQKLLQKPPSATDAPAAAAPISGNLRNAPMPDVISGISSFVTNTLLQVPNSSLRRAYMQQCAALLAALLAQPPAAATAAACTAQQQDVVGIVGRPLQQLLYKQQNSSQLDAAALQVVGLSQQLLQSKLHYVQQQQQERCNNSSAASDAISAAAAMLQQMSTFPSTALLMALAVAQQLQQLVVQLQQANAAASSTIQLADLAKGQLQAGARALHVTANLFEASHELITELDQAIQQLPAWAVALSSCTWTAKALDDLVSITASLYQSCPQLQQHQFLLAQQLCDVAAGLATSLQHVATAADAPGMRSSSGAALRSACGGLCMRLRDLFMPNINALE